MTDPRIAWFAMGATFGLVLCGWPWHLRFSRYSRMQDPDWRRSISHENTNRPSGPPPLKLRRSEPDPPEQFICMTTGLVQRGNGSGGPTTPKPEIVPGFHGPRRTVRWFINNPVQIAECGGPCTVGPTHCDCGALWVDVPTTNQPPTDP